MATSTQESSAEGPSSNFTELDMSYLKASYPHANFDFDMLAKEMEEEYQQIRKETSKGLTLSMRSEVQRLKTFLSQPPGNALSTWAPLEMAAAGFYHTGTKTAIQCFCCGLVLLARSIKRSPYVEHKKYWSQCAFILGKEVGNIPKYEIRVLYPRRRYSGVTYKDLESRLQSFADWPSYAREAQPDLLAKAGFFFTGIKDTVQCFACSGCLGNWEDGDDPWKEHAKWFPECEFLQKEKTRDEIKEYIQNYCAFVGLTAKHFTPCTGKILDSDPGDLELAINIYEDEGCRLDSFQTWPAEARVDATSLAKAGFFYTGKMDIVQCFSCAGCLAEWKGDDDPWEGHAKAFPHCNHSDPERKTSLEKTHKEAEAESWHGKQMDHKDDLADTEVLSSAMTNVAFEEHKLLQEQLRRAYDDIHFRKMFPFGDSAHFAIDLKTLFGDLAIVSKNISNLPLQQLTLPEVLENFQFITVVEGEAGSGKTALLRKIAILWASGCCPILSRYKLVFYLSLNSQNRDLSLVDIICNEVVGLRGVLTQEFLETLCKHLKNEILFLLDDYDEMNAVPYDIEDLIQKNYLNKHCLVIAVRTNRIGKIRQYAKTILGITDFPMTSTFYLLRKLFSHNTALVEDFFIQLRVEEAMHSMFKTPLFVVALGTYWTQNPNGSKFLDLVILKAYMLYTSLKYPQACDRMKATVSACGELALRGLFTSLFEFSEEDLSEVGVSGDDALWFGLLSKFTAQRLWPIYKFFHLSFQEYFAGLRMNELLSSDVQEDVDRGLQYLQQINTFVKISGRYQYILRYACVEASKAVPQIVTHLLSLPSCEKSFESQIKNDLYLQQTPELKLRQQELLSVTLTLFPEVYLSTFSDFVLELVTELAYQSNMTPACAPIISQFLAGKEFSLDHFSSKGGFIRRFFLDYPDTLFLPSRFVMKTIGKEENLDMSVEETVYSNLGVPVVDQEYASGFRLFSDVSKQIKEDEDNINKFRTYFPRRFPNSRIVPFLCKRGQEKIPHLQFSAKCINAFQTHDLENLAVLFSVFSHIDLKLQNCKGLLENIKPAIEQNLEYFKVCSIHNTALNLVEENLLLSMSSLESLEITGKASIPESLFLNLDKYTFLKELSVDLPNCQNLFDIIPEGFKNLHDMEKFIICNIQFGSSSPRLAEFIRNFKKLSVFHLKHCSFSDLGSLMDAMSSCKMLTELEIIELPFTDEDQFSLTAALPNFAALKILNLNGLNFTSKEIGIALGEALAPLENLEELSLPVGNGMSHAAKLIIQQCSHFPNLRKLEFNQYLSGEGLLEIAKVATDGGFQKLEVLTLLVNHSITEEFWRRFFESLPQLPKLHDANFGRIFTHPIKCQAATVKSFVQCVSRQQNLKVINMTGWLFDEKDLQMFDIMKEQHPQSKNLSLFWKWMLPVSPIINK
nr:PREDICTED: LOW QUALITY PROTEIN: baculoviral IAP repeat-containing protein 1 [Anolis carolinensis]|eukprot:XP_008101181.1 PREDICTED: LOW QUALITY PROTEIN: baculoviral IAP repeat-containing protein 1 [Anolis carolinensis]